MLLNILLHTLHVLLQLSLSTFYQCPWRWVNITIHASVTPTVTRSVGPGWWVTANSTRVIAILRTSACTPRTARAVEARSPRVTTINVTATTTACEIHLRAHPSDTHHVSKTPLLSHLNSDYILETPPQHFCQFFKYLS